MKNILSVLCACSMLLGYLPVKAQTILSSSQTDILIPEISPQSLDNSGIAVAPGSLEYTAVVYDNPDDTYTIKWLDNTGQEFYSFTRPGNDPDVAYYSNADICIVVYELFDNIYMDKYHLQQVLPSPSYSYGGIFPIGTGHHPNIDINSSGSGVVCWTEPAFFQDRIGLRAFNPSNMFLYDAVYAFGTTYSSYPANIQPSPESPDIVVHDDDYMVTMTYLHDYSKELHIRNYELFGLKGGVFGTSMPQLPSWLSQIGSHNVSASPNTPSNLIHWTSAPRIAAPRNISYLNGSPQLKNYTVVAARRDLSTSQKIITGLFYDGLTSISSINRVDLNDGLDECNAGTPVVAYNKNRVSVAWKGQHISTCTAGLENTKILHIETDFNGNPASPSIYNQVNSNADDFHHAQPAITQKYDGGYPVSNTGITPFEAIFFNAGLNIGGYSKYWKSRTNMNLLYRESKPEEDKFSADLMDAFPVPFSNILTLSIKGNIEYGGEVLIKNMLGQQVFKGQIKETIEISTEDWPNGTYIIEYHVDEELFTTKVIK